MPPNWIKDYRVKKFTFSLAKSSNVSQLKQSKGVPATR